MATKKKEHDLIDGVDEIIGFYNEQFEKPHYKIIEKAKYDKLLQAGIYVDLLVKHEIDAYAPEDKYDKFFKEYEKTCKEKGVPVEE